MRIITVLLLLIASAAHAQVDMSEKEKIEQQRSNQRQQDALRDSALKPNERATTPAPAALNIDSSAQFDVDHSSLGYSMLFESDNAAAGVKFSGAFTVAVYNETKKEKKSRLMVGLELPIDVELPIRNVVPFAGGGLQFGSGLSLYGNTGLDYRLAKWFKLQFGVNFDTQHQAGGIIGAGLTW